MAFTFLRALCKASLIALLVLSYGANASVQPLSIKASSINWHDLNARIDLLKKLPRWTPETIEQMFDAYQHPNVYDLPKWVNGTPLQYNALFINAFFGPIGNPFVKFKRPAKAFLFIGEDNQYFMVPLIESQADGLAYVFDQESLQPMLIEDWVNHKTVGRSSPIRFNVCQGYGVLPEDSCNDNNYESEIYRYPNDPYPLFQNQLWVSAHRAQDQSWEVIASNHQSPKQDLATNIINTSVLWSDNSERTKKLEKSASWSKYKIIKNNYKAMRNLRYFQDEKIDNFARRITWLFPDDGCWTRLASMMKDFFGPRHNPASKFPRPSKIFAFGNLCVNTPNHKEGAVRWWYHTAPIVRDAKKGKFYVIDPSIADKKPIEASKWIKAITAHDGACKDNVNDEIKINVCDGYGVDPYDYCDYMPYENFEKEISAMLIQRYFRRFERERQYELGRDPNAVLGNAPPW